MSIFQKMNLELNEGGAGGHMAHPYELSNEEMIEFFDSFFAGQLETTEKVDGVNLFVGYNRSGKLVIARTAKEEYTTPREKFRSSHGGISSFEGGYQAIKSRLDQLTQEEKIKYKLIDDSGMPLNFINLEIIKGPKPNLIKYSTTKNYIVFHTLAGTRETDWTPQELEGVNVKSLLINLANKLSTTQTEVEIPSYSGEDDSLERRFIREPIVWTFQGPININSASMNVSKETKNIWQNIRSTISRLSEDDFEKKKSLCLDLGAHILGDTKSQLSDQEPDPGMPGVEGLAVVFKGSLVKITGNFATINQSIEHTSKDWLADVTEYIMKDVLGLKVKTMLKPKVEEVGNVSSFLKSRNPKLDLQKNLSINEKNRIKELIFEAITGLSQQRKTASHQWVKDSSASQIVDLKRLWTDIESSNTVKDAAIALFNNIFWQKDSRLSENFLTKKQLITEDEDTKNRMISTILRYSDSLIDIDMKPEGPDVVSGTVTREKKGDIRFPMLFSSDIVKQNLIDIFKSNGFDDVSVRVVEKKDRLHGAKSGKFTTFVVSSGEDDVYIVNTKINVNSKVGIKKLSPDALGMGGKIYEAYDLYLDAFNKINDSKLPVLERDFILNSLNSVYLTDISFSSIEEMLQQKKATINKINEELEIPFDIENIYNDFGEVLNALFVSTTLEAEVEFPDASNQKLYDFKANGERFSSKNKSGANNTIDNIYHEILKNDLDKHIDSSEKYIFKFLETVATTSPKSIATLKAAKMYNTTGWKELRKMMLEEINLDNSIDARAKMNKFIDLLYEKYGDDIIDMNINMELNSFYKQCVPNKFPDLKTLLSMIKTGDKNRYGYLTYPVFSNFVREFNSDPENTKSLTSLFNKISYKQIYITPDDKKKKLTFEIVKSEDVTIQLSTSGPYAANPNNTGIKFEIIK